METGLYSCCFYGCQDIMMLIKWGHAVQGLQAVVHRETDWWLCCQFNLRNALKEGGERLVQDRGKEGGKGGEQNGLVRKRERKRTKQMRWIRKREVEGIWRVWIEGVSSEMQGKGDKKQGHFLWQRMSEKVWRIQCVKSGRTYYFVKMLSWLIFIHSCE